MFHLSYQYKLIATVISTSRFHPQCQHHGSADDVTIKVSPTNHYQYHDTNTRCSTLQRTLQPQTLPTSDFLHTLHYAHFPENPDPLKNVSEKLQNDRFTIALPNEHIFKNIISKKN